MTIKSKNVPSSSGKLLKYDPLVSTYTLLICGEHNFHLFIKLLWIVGYLRWKSYKIWKWTDTIMLKIIILIYYSKQCCN